MKMHRIADLNVALRYKEKILSEQAPAYEIEPDAKPDLVINLSEGLLNFLQEKNPELDADWIEYIYTGADFFDKIPGFDAFMLHSSAVEYKGKAYLFSAASGTGKSTHTELWLKVFGDEARIINDDKPIIRVIDGKVYAYGTPWSGKNTININTKVEVGGICFLERARKNSIEKISSAEAIGLILNQTNRPRDLVLMDKLLGCLDKVLKNVNVYRLYANMEEEAAVVAYNGMKND